MAIKVWLISHAANAALKAGVFGAASGDDGDFDIDAARLLDVRAVEAVAAWRTRWAALIDGSGESDESGRSAPRALTSPAAIARASAAAAGFDARIEPALSDTAYGAWSGRRLIDIAQETPDALAAWTRDPAFQPPGGGESFEAVRERVSAWLDALPDAHADASLVAFTHASVIRAAVLHALDAPSAAFRQLEIAPLSVTQLRRTSSGWVWVASA
ncbi:MULTISPECIES: histidine phosphatase family protein [unclassified Paraburkholderia]|uniref:histidine phosphatase family protein n=1 Tax=unclassified Paraburkholderia TaxID=2615204 RepID=UPI002AB14B42|nr:MULTISPECIES: histidine phosphatase family protein [unclassified Paraburkholderia]